MAPLYRPDRDMVLKSRSRTTILFFHGYTGSVTDFSDTPAVLHRETGARVRVLRFSGHGTTIDDLSKRDYREFLAEARSAAKEERRRCDRLVLGGVSLGAMIALTLAKEVRPEAVIVVSTPYRFRGFLSLPGVNILSRAQRRWPKNPTEEERTLRHEHFSYEHIPSQGIQVVFDSRRDVDAAAKGIECPVLILHNARDHLCDDLSVAHLVSRLRHAPLRIILFDHLGHNIFYTSLKPRMQEEMVMFLRGLGLAPKAERRVAAIVPCYNEAPRIGKVLSVLTASKDLDEVIVVDDGSTDGTADVVKRFKVRYERRDRNYGKAAAMRHGVDATDAEIIFFCDADLEGLDRRTVSEVLKPVLEDKTVMSLAIRSNITQCIWGAWNADLTGERAMRRELWEKLPAHYKRKFRIEAGLNGAARHGGHGYVARRFSNLFQTFKETKWGFWCGLRARILMDIDIAIGFAYAGLIDVPRTARRYRRTLLRTLIAAAATGASLILAFPSAPLIAAGAGLVALHQGRNAFLLRRLCRRTHWREELQTI